MRTRTIAKVTPLNFHVKVKCDFDHNVFILASFMDITYLALFINFFLKSYIIGGGKDKYKQVPVKDSKKKN